MSLSLIITENTNHSVMLKVTFDVIMILLYLPIINILVAKYKHFIN